MFPRTRALDLGLGINLDQMYDRMLCRKGKGPCDPDIVGQEWLVREGLGATECVEQCNAIWSSPEEQEICRQGCAQKATAVAKEPAIAAFGAGGKQIAKYALIAAALLVAVPFLKRAIVKE